VHELTDKQTAEWTDRTSIAYYTLLMFHRLVIPRKKRGFSSHWGYR